MGEKEELVMVRVVLGGVQWLGFLGRVDKDKEWIII